MNATLANQSFSAPTRHCLLSQDLSNTGSALKTAFELLNLSRLQTMIDTYGQVHVQLNLSCLYGPPRNVSLFTVGQTLLGFLPLGPLAVVQLTLLPHTHW